MKVKTGTARIAWGVVLIVVLGFLLLRALLMVVIGSALGNDGATQAGAFVGLLIVGALLFGAIRLLLRGLTERRVYLASLTAPTQAPAVEL
jgi:hypothetical protein